MGLHILDIVFGHSKPVSYVCLTAPSACNKGELISAFLCKRPSGLLKFFTLFCGLVPNYALEAFRADLLLFCLSCFFPVHPIL